MKKYIYAMLVASSMTTLAGAQTISKNDEKARSIYPKAVEFYNNKEYSKALNKVAEMEKLLNNKTNARLSYLKAKAAYALADYNTAEGACKSYFESRPKNDSGYQEMSLIKESVIAYRQAEMAQRQQAAAAFEQAEQERKARAAEEDRQRKLQMQAAAERRAEWAKHQDERDEVEKNAYEAAVKTGTKEAMQNFIYDFPNGKFTAQAKREMNKKWAQPTRTLVKSKYGYTLNGKLVVKAKYEQGSDFSDGLARVAKGGKYGFVNESGVEVIPTKYNMASNFSYGAAAVKDENNVSYYIGTNGEKLSDETYLETKSFSEGLAACQDDNYLYGFVNNKGELVVQHKFNYVSWFKEGNCAVGKNVDGAVKYGYIDSKGLQLCGFMYDEAKDFQGGVARVKMNGKYGLVDRFGSQITCCDYDYIGEFKNDGYALAKRSNLEVYLDKEGQAYAKVNGKYISVSF